MKKLTSAALAALLLAGSPAVTFAEETQPETGTQEETQEITEESGTRSGFREFRPGKRPAGGEMTAPETDGETGATPAKPEGELTEDGSLPEMSREMRKGRGMGRGSFSKEDMEFIENNEEAQSIMEQIRELIQKLRDLINSQKDTDTVTSDSL